MPAAIAEEVISAAEELINTQSPVRIAIGDGVDPQQAYLQYGKF